MHSSRGVRWGALALAVVLIVAVAGCGAQAGQAQSATVEMHDYRFEPATVTVRANTPVRITVDNKGSVVHDWTVEQEIGGEKIHLVADPNSSASAEFTPTQPGTYKVTCTQPGHAQLGMVGELVVQ